VHVIVTTRASNTETQLLGYIAWQWDRYLITQYVFLVNIKKNIIQLNRLLPILLQYTEVRTFKDF